MTINKESRNTIAIYKNIRRTNVRAKIRAVMFWKSLLNSGSCRKKYTPQFKMELKIFEKDRLHICL